MKQIVTSVAVSNQHVEHLRLEVLNYLNVLACLVCRITVKKAIDVMQDVSDAAAISQSDGPCPEPQPAALA